MLMLPAMAGAWMLVLQGNGQSSSSVTVLPRNFTSQRECEVMGETMRKKFWVAYLCIPGDEHERR